MIRNYFKLALKSIISQGQQSIINAIGMAVALSCSILVLLYVQYELSYDKYHENADLIYRIVSKQSGNQYHYGKPAVLTPGPLKEALVKDIPGIRYSTKCLLRSHVLGNNSSLFTEDRILYTDPDFFKVFTFPVISGNPVEALREPFTIFLTKEMSDKYFGNEDPVGKKIIADNKYVFTVRGVIENIPKNSHFNFDFVTGFESLYSLNGGKNNVENWNSNSFATYFQLMDNANPENINSKLKDIVVKYTKADPEKFKFIAEPLTWIHLGGNANHELSTNSDVRYLYLVSSIVILIILIACFSYMNMATARSYNRGREIGILKVAGSGKRNLIMQFLTESVLLSFGGLIIAIVIVWLLMPFFSGFTERPLSFRMIFEHSNLVKIIALMLLTGLFAGFYPAFHLSSVSPFHLINEDFKNKGGKKRSGYLRNMFVVMQYIISIVALICTFTVLRQLSFMKTADPGFVKDNILSVYLRDPLIRKNPEALINELRANPGVIDVTTSANLPVTIRWNWNADWEGREPESNQSVFITGIGKNWLDFYNVKIIAGRGFSDEFLSDTSNSIIINQKTANTFGWAEPVGKKLGFGGKMRNVIGIIRDFNFNSFRLSIEPLAIMPLGSEIFPRPSYISVRVNPDTFSDTKLFVEKKLKEFSPNYLNTVTVFSDRVDEMYVTDRKMATIFIFSTILAVILTCLGQYSLSSYTTKSRTKEMVIRKVMGSTPSGIMSLFTGDMAKWILISILFAWPVAYMLMTKWLQSFAYHVKIGTGVFIYSLLITILISLMAISYHVIKLSRVNPAEMIRQE